MSEEKPNQQEQIKFKRDDLRKYFPPNYTDEQIKKDIDKGMELLKRQRERNRDARWFEPKCLRRNNSHNGENSEPAV